MEHTLSLFDRTATSSPAHATRALVVVPPFLKRGNGPLLGPALLAASGRRAGHEVDVLDLSLRWLQDHAPTTLVDVTTPFVGDHDRPSASLRDAQRRWAATCADVLPSPPPSLLDDAALTLAFDHDEVLTAVERLADSPLGDWIRRQLEVERAPAVVGLSVMYSGQVLAALVASRMARRLWPSATIVWGGAHVTALRDTIATDSRYGRWVDRFVFGYAERTWASLLDAVARGGPFPREVVRPGDGVAVLAEDDARTEPAFDGLASSAPGARTTLPVQTSRGCAYGRCTFCTYPAIEGVYRAHDLDVLEAVVRSAATIGAAVSLKDSLVLPQRLTAVADLVAGRVVWSACTKLHPRFDAPFLAHLARNGCRTLEVGLETLTPSGQLTIDKRQTLPLFLSVLDAATEVGIAVVVNYITGFPGVDEDEERRWLDRVRAELDARPRLVAKIEHNRFQLERTSPMGRVPAAFGLQVRASWPWSSVLAWDAAPALARSAG